MAAAQGVEIAAINGTDHSVLGTLTRLTKRSFHPARAYEDFLSAAGAVKWAVSHV